MSSVRYRKLDQVEGEWRPAVPEEIREFATAQARLERLPNWERLGDDWAPRNIANEPRVGAPAWADQPGPGTPRPVPPAEGSGLVVVRSTRRDRRGQPAATIEGTKLDTEG